MSIEVEERAFVGSLLGVAIPKECGGPHARCEGKPTVVIFVLLEGATVEQQQRHDPVFACLPCAQIFRDMYQDHSEGNGIHTVDMMRRSD